MLGLRYVNDKKCILKLNNLQFKMKKQIEQKVKQQVYVFEKVPCAVCGGHRHKLLAEKDRYGLYMSVVICEDCGLIQTNPRMTQCAYNEFYNSEYRKLYVGIEEPDNRFFQAQYKKGRRISEWIRKNNFKKNFEQMFVLEIGCGAGGLLKYFKDMGCRVKGIDLGSSYIEYGQKHYNLDISVGTIDTLYLHEEPDLIIYSHVLEHILSPNEELKKIYNILSDRGLLYIEVPGVKNLMNSYEMDFLRLLQNAHTFHFTLKTLINLLKKNDFEFLQGNEIIYSVFKKAKAVKKTSKKIENDFSDAMAYLQRLEFYRKFFPFPPYKISSLTKSIIIKFLEKIGMFDSARDLYQKLKKLKQNK